MWNGEATDGGSTWHGKVEVLEGCRGTDGAERRPGNRGVIEADVEVVSGGRTDGKVAIRRWRSSGPVHPCDVSHETPTLVE